MIKSKQSNWIPIIETVTPAVVHAAPTVIAKLDSIQKSCVEHMGLSTQQACLVHNLFSLCTRRCIAMLGLLFKIAHGFTHPSFQDVIPHTSAPANSSGPTLESRTRQLSDKCNANHQCMMSGSLFESPHHGSPQHQH